MDTPSSGTVVAACLVAVVLGLLQPFGAVFSMILVIGTVLTAVFWAWAGYVPLILYVGASAASMKFFFGSEAALAQACMMLLPAACVVYAIVRKAPFSRRVGAGVIAQFLAFALLIAVLYTLFRQDLATVAVDGLTSTVRQMTADMRLMMLRRFAMIGMFDDALTEQIIRGSLAADAQIEALGEMYGRFGEALRLALPALLVSSGIVTGVLTAYLPSRILAARGLDEGYTPFSKWYVPHTVVYGILTALAAAFVMNAEKMNGSEAVLGAVRAGGVCVAVIAGAASLDRHMKMAGRPRGLRYALIAGGLLLASTGMAVVGVISMTMGQNGVISTYLRKKGENHKEDDD
ncbi:MAG: DUF2232 domain-containing protein [Clostridia bacterium]|nr:DUF2232 domain-containing protein [Clostridia bacterium]